MTMRVRPLVFAVLAVALLPIGTAKAADQADRTFYIVGGIGVGGREEVVPNPTADSVLTDPLFQQIKAEIGHVEQAETDCTSGQAWILFKLNSLKYSKPTLWQAFTSKYAYAPVEMLEYYVPFVPYHHHGVAIYLKPQGNTIDDHLRAIADSGWIVNHHIGYSDDTSVDGTIKARGQYEWEKASDLNGVKNIGALGTGTIDMFPILYVSNPATFVQPDDRGLRELETMYWGRGYPDPSIPTEGPGFTACFNPSASRSIQVRAGASRDPNVKAGSEGAGVEHFISGSEPLRYDISFTDEETASAPAQEVVVTDRLDPSNVDLSSLSLGPMSFGDHIVAPPPGVSDFTTDVDLRPAKNLIVRVSANLDTTTDVLTWRFHSLDPTTMQAPDDPLVGFLPPNTSPPDGEGSVFFTVMPKAGLGTGTEIRNKATIVFDQNAPIDTQEWLNTLDNSKPSSSVAALPAAETSPSFDVSWSGTDSGSGIQDYTVFVSEDGGPFNAWQVDTASTSATFTGQPRKRYAFYSVGRDATGNVEDAPVRADATTIVAAGDTTPPVISCASSDGLWHSANVSIACTARDDGSGLANPADANFSLSTQVPSGSETSNAQTERREVCDNAGNCASAGPIGGNMVDRKGPSITLTAPPANGSGDYLFKAPVPASYSCSDGGSGMSGGSASCTGTVPNGSNIATSSVGAQPFAVDATDAVGNPARVTTTYNVHATTSLAYNGQQIVSANSTLLVGAKLSSAASSCSSGRTIAFFLDGDPDGAGPMTAVLGVVTTDSSGQATLALQTTNWTVGAVYTVTASYAGAAACLASSDSTGTLIVSSPGDSADGGGWYTVAGSGRSNFGFVVNKVPNTTTYKGQILFMNTGKWRLKGDLNGYSKSGSSASLAGTGNLYYWDQTLNGGLGDWLLSQWGVAFAISYTDVGTATKTSSDTFGIIINHLVLSPPEPSTLPSSKPQALKGGNITIR
jgi:hypothetical protein